MDKEKIIEKLHALIKENLEVELPESIKESDRLYEDLGIDSIMVMQLVVYLEEGFGVEIPEEEVDPANFQTVSGLVAFIDSLLTNAVT